jgi:signal transduction histidine kinase
VAAAVGIAVLVLVFVYPLVRSLARVFARMTEIAQQVSAGHFGRTLGIRRPGELGTLIEAFDDMSKKLADAEKLNTRLLHDVSHELRSPLGRIQVMAQTITHRPEEGGECIRGICEEVALLDRLVGDLLQTARFEARSETTTFTRFEVVAWARETLGRLEAKARSRGVTFSAHFPGEEKMASGDPQRLAQAVGNLVDNAVDALRDHAAGRIEATLSLGDDRWSVSVRDNGPGIPEADQPHVFRRFYRVGQDRSRDRGGVGLGLSLVRAIAVAHGGRAILDSRPGHGTVVTLELPIAPEGLAEADASGKPTLS